MACRYSPIAPITILQILQESEVLENYLLLLAHDVLASEADYVFLMDEMAHPKLAAEMIIMDNGVIELGKALPFEDVIAAAEIVTAECIIMPDVLGNLEETQLVVALEMDKMRECDYPIMKVPQGKDYQEVVYCIKWLTDVMPVTLNKDYWGIPRWIANELGTRGPTIEYINRYNKHPKIHLLGMSNNWKDDLYCSHLPNVIGIDSANPLVLGLKDHYMGDLEYYHAERGDFWDQTDINFNVLRNINYVRKCFAETS